MSANPITRGQGRAWLGCSGWSPETRVATCVVGTGMHGSTSDYRFVLVGSDEPPMALAVTDTEMRGPMFDPAIAGTLDAKLAEVGVEPLIGEGEIVEPGSTDLGGGASLVWTKQLVRAGADDAEPTHAHSIVVNCASDTIPVLGGEASVVDPFLRHHRVPGHAILTMASQVGEADHVTAIVVDVRACTSARAQ